jgi:hypothetical protein
MLSNSKDKDKLGFLFQELRQPLVPSTFLLVIYSTHHILPSFSNLNSCFVMPKLTRQNRMFQQNRFLFPLNPERLMFAPIE